MGAEAAGRFTVRGKSTKGNARLETDVLQLRGADVRLSIPFKAMRNVRSSNGVLRFESPEGRVELELGPAAPQWADKILHPPSRLAKIRIFSPSSKPRPPSCQLAERSRSAMRFSSARPRPRSSIVFQR